MIEEKCKELVSCLFLLFFSDNIFLAESEEDGRSERSIMQIFPKTAQENYFPSNLIFHLFRWY
jgi:hypothetical protein